MSWTNYHTHCRFCDGAGEPREYVEAALARDMKALGFSSHAPVPFPTDWIMKIERLEEYCRTVRALRLEYDGRIDVRLGLEIEYIPGLTGPRNPLFGACGLEYTIGSVHFVDRFEDGEHWSVDSTLEIFERGLSEIFGGDARRAVERYYTLVREMLVEQAPDILGHLDVVKKFNPDNRFFQDSAPWYREAAFETLEAVARSGVILEVNTGQLARKSQTEANPGPWILERARELAVPVTLNSDAHHPDLVAGEFENTAALLLEIGFEKLMVLGRDGWVPKGFTRDGLIESP